MAKMVLNQKENGNYEVIDIEKMEVVRNKGDITTEKLLDLTGTYYVHDLKKQAKGLNELIIKNGVEYSNRAERNSYNKVQNSEREMFSFRYQGNRARVLTLKDSKKILNFTIDKLRTEFLATEEEISDGMVVAKSLKEMFDRDFTKNTMASNAFNFWKDYQYEDGYGFRKQFPELGIETDDFIRRSYNGGLCYAHPQVIEAEGLNGITLDINSMYPYVMKNFALPYGVPKQFTGKYKIDRRHPLYIQRVKINWMSIKDGCIPCIFKPGIAQFEEEGLIEDMNNVELVLTNIDLQLLKDSYDYGKIEYCGGFMFKSCKGTFDDYIDYFMDMKINAETETDRKIAKLFLNSLYGKFGTKVRRNVYEYKVVDGKEVRRFTGEIAFGEMYYTAMASFITSYARTLLATAANNNSDYFCYCDTDSLHLDCSLDEVQGLTIDSKELGAWKLERTWSDAKFLGKKKYMEFDGSWHIVCAGMPPVLTSQVDSKEKFSIGNTFEAPGYKFTITKQGFGELNFKEDK